MDFGSFLESDELPDGSHWMTEVGIYISKLIYMESQGNIRGKNKNIIKSIAAN